MNRIKPAYLLALLIPASALTQSCIENDIPYPHLQQNIISLAAVGESSAASIDTKNLTATVYLSEDVNPRAVKFSEYSCSENASSSINLLDGTYDLTSPLEVTLSLYQDYLWTISAQQTIERYFTIAGQIGPTSIDVAGKRVVLYVPDTFDRSRLTVTSIKLGPEGHTSLSPDLKAGDVADFTDPVKIAVRNWDITEEWTIYVDTTEALVTTTSADAWVNVVWVYGAGPEDAVNGFQYRLASDSEWTDVPASLVQHDGGSFHVAIPHLLPLTGYVVRAVSGENTGNEIEVTTGVATPLPDSSFDQWWLDGKVWCPWAEGGISWWDTGNTGASTLGQSNVSPSTNTPTGKGQSACLETRFVGVAGIGKLAAGSIFSGSFVKVDGTNGILDFGRPWSECPTRLRGYYNYTTSPINYASSEFQYLMNRPDSCHIWIALTDMDAPCRIRTNPKDRQLFDQNDPGVIAYGQFVRGENSNGWQEFVIDLKYNSTSRKPKYLLVVTAASKYGDYFTGGTGSTLYVDDFSLDYDY